MKENIIVTGGAGYIGSHICKILKQRGYNPIVIDNLSNGYSHFVKWGPLVIGDIREKEVLRETFLNYKPAAVIHCAGLISVDESIKDPKAYYENNVLGTLTLMEAMVMHNVKKIIFSSTCATYGPTQESKISETYSQNPISPYGRSKLMIEQIIKDYSKAYQLQHAILRYFNAAGADFDVEIGENHVPETHLIPLILEAVEGKRPEIHIYGDDFPTPDRSAIRDFIHVIDLAIGHVEALEYLTDKQNSLILNLGSGKGTSVKEVVRVVEKITGKNIPSIILPRREGDAAMLIANIQKAQAYLKWEPRFSNIEAIILSAWKWHKQQNALHVELNQSPCFSRN